MSQGLKPVNLKALPSKGSIIEEVKRALDINNEPAPEISRSQEVEIKEAVVDALNDVRRINSVDK